jgi:hypothetical protein
MKRRSEEKLKALADDRRGLMADQRRSELHPATKRAIDQELALVSQQIVEVADAAFDDGKEYGKEQG